MITNNIHTIRESVILLLRRNGYSVIDAVDLWDRVYSQQYERAAPGHKTTWVIGDHHFEFTKVRNGGEPKITALPEPPAVSKGLTRLVAIFAALCLIGIVIVFIIANL